MKKCTECGFENPEDMHICLRCAAELQRTCPTCGAVISTNNKFCGQCGTKIENATPVEHVAPSVGRNRSNLQEQLLRNLRDKMPATLMQKISQSYSQQLHGQRREVTVLCVDIANLVEAGQKIDSEELYLAIDYIMHRITNVVYRYEGTIDQFSGQGITALFGIPLNHENDPERAVRAGFEMLFEMNQDKEHIIERFNFDLQIRIGINTGSVIIGEMGAQQHVEFTVIGDTVNLANQLLTSAQANQILVSFSTYQRSSHIFDYQTIELEPSREAHATDHQEVFQPVALLYKPGQVRGLPGMRVPMVGRMEDFKAIQQEKDSALANSQSRIVLVSGDAGLGKSRLVAEFINEQQRENCASYWGTCASYLRITPYRVIADVIRSILGISELDPIEQQRDALQAYIDTLHLSQQDSMPNLLHVLGLLHFDPIAEARLRLLEPLMLQRETQMALRTFFTAVTQQKFSIFIFDDLHWVDQASQQFLEYYCQVIDKESLLLVLVSRDFESIEPARLIASAAQKHAVTPVQIHLEPLSVQDSRLLIDQFLPEKNDRAVIIKNAIIKRAAGNPFYTEELVRILMDNNGVEFQNGKWIVAEKAIQLMKEVPGTLQDILLARFDRLPTHLRQTAQRASVLGDSFAIRLLEVIFPGSREELKANLSELEARDFLISSRLGNEEGFLFKHPLLQETIYLTLLKKDLRNLHFEIAQAIESGEHWLPAERNQILAWHYGESHTPNRAIPFLLASAEKASQHFANETVIHLYRQVLTLMESDLSYRVDQIKNAKIQLGKALKFSGRFEEALQIFENLLQDENLPASTAKTPASPSPFFIECLREVADIRSREGKLEDAEKLLLTGMRELGDEARTNNPIAWRYLVDRLAWVYFRQGKLDESHNWADLALMDLRNWETDDPITLASLYNTVGGIYWSRSRFQDAITSVENSLSIYQNLGYQWGVSIALTNLGVLNYSIGKWQACIDYLERADQIRDDFGNHPERPSNLINLSEALISIGDYNRAREKLNISVEISKRLGSQIYLAFSELKLAHLAILEENETEAKDHLDKVKALITSSDEASEKTAQYYQYDSERLLLIEKPIEALVAAEKALEISEQGSYEERQIFVLQTLGRIHMALSNFELAERYLQQSINLKGGQFCEALSLLEMSRLSILRAQTSPHEEWVRFSQAENYLDRAISAFTNLGARRFLQTAQSLYATLPARLSNQIQPPDSSIDEIQTLAKLRKELGLPNSEWFQTTILSLDVIPNQYVDEEILFETSVFLIPLLQEVIQENGGQIIRNKNGLTGIFGAPVAHEDDPVRAVDTAMQIVNFHTELLQQTDLPVSIRIGISMGKVVAGWLEKPSTVKEPGTGFLASGTPLALSRTLANIVSPSRIWVTQAVYNATAFRFQFDPVHPRLVDSLEEKAIFQLVGEREQILPVRGLIGLRTVFVGRQSEIDVLLDAFNKMTTNTGHVIWVEGEPGIGKSRLTREFQSQIRDQEVIIWRGTCTARRMDIAFSVFSDLLANALDIQSNFSPDQIYQHIERFIEKWALDQEIQPFIQLLVGVQPTGTQGEQIMALEPEQLRRQSFISLNRFVTRLATVHPIIIIIDDIQWIDSISADLLLYLSPLIFTQKVMFVCVQRINEASEYENTLAKMRKMVEQQLSYLHLKPLTSDECRALLNLVLENAELEETLKSLIVQQSGGNPYYIEEFIRMLIEQDYMRVVRGKLEINQNLEIDTLHIPTSLETLIRARIDALPYQSRQTLHVASIIGHQFSEELLGAIAEKSDIHLQMEFLQSRGILVNNSETRLWEFGHPMIEIIVYNTVLRAQRRILHNRTAMVLEEQWAGQESEHADELAYHYSRAENHAKTLEYLILAGERAASRYANDTAMGYFEQANDLLSVLRDATDYERWKIITGLGEVYQFTGKYDASQVILQSGIEQLQNSPLAAQQHASLYRILAETYYMKGDYDQAIEIQMKALSFVDQSGDMQSDSEAARIYVRLGWSYFRKAKFEIAQKSVLAAEELASRTKNLSAMAQAENLLGGINWSRGFTKQAMQHTRLAMLHYQELGYTPGEAVALNNLAILEANSGNWNSAANFFKRALQLRKEMGDVEGIAVTNNNLAHLAFDQGKFSDAEKYCTASLAVSEPLRISYHQAVAYTIITKVAVTQQRYKEASRISKIALQLAKDVDARETLAELRYLEALICLHTGEIERAESTAKSAIQAAADIDNSVHESTARRVLSQVLEVMNQPEKGLAVLDEAWERLSKNVDDLERGRVNSQYAKLWFSLLNQEKATSYAQEARAIFSNLGAEFDLKQLDILAPPT